jgi:hypothetical protein
VGGDRLDLGKAEWSAFVPGEKAAAGATWEVSRKVAHALFQRCYPPGPHWDVKDSKVLSGRLDAKLTGLTAREATVRLTGSFSLRYPSRGEPADGRMTAKVSGLVRYDRARGEVRSFLLASEEADYVWQWKGKPVPRKMRVAVEGGR